MTYQISINIIIVNIIIGKNNPRKDTGQNMFGLIKGDMKDKAKARMNIPFNIIRDEINIFFIFYLR